MTSGPVLRSSETPLRPVAPYEYRYEEARRGRLVRRLRRAARNALETLLIVLLAAALTYAALVYLGLVETATVIGVENVIRVEEDLLHRGP